MTSISLVNLKWRLLHEDGSSITQQHDAALLFLALSCWSALECWITRILWLLQLWVYWTAMRDYGVLLLQLG
ncbi:hypothetical protein NC653_031978 [Populus alba x Populus x berolinensis]|uniref:Uncharacterized protein n=1 Tax=Populus alba x Populus x berolinensis TaxID=444605 RepID=A0AAD6M033_9ROSI|nr:hypothetical protein NC653_031978 [Populus alba x Populus x berolinensis]